MLLSNQSEWKFNVYERIGSHNFLGSYDISYFDGVNVDPVRESDGIDVISYPFGSTFPQGAFVVHDDQSGTGENSNFKVVPWQSIADSLDLIIDTSVNPRLLGISQNITLYQGWNSISSYLIPGEREPEKMFSNLGNQLITLINESGYYYPESGQNTLGNWETHSGYMIKLSSTIDFSVSGGMEMNRSVFLSAGWNLMPVLSDETVSVDEIASQLANNLIIIKEAAGISIFWPDQQVTQLTHLEPGKSYFIKIVTDDMINF